MVMSMLVGVVTFGVFCFGLTGVERSQLNWIEREEYAREKGKMGERERASLDTREGVSCLYFLRQTLGLPLRKCIGVWINRL